MGVVGSKSPLERRNTVLRRSQRKSIHGVKSKIEKLVKDIKKFKGTEENSDYVELKARIETAERELKIQARNLQPQINHIYNETLKKTQECYKLLNEKLNENYNKLKEVQEKQALKENKIEEKDNDDDDDVFLEELEEPNPEESGENKRTVELKVIQMEQIDESPQVNKRFSAMKIGVPVLPRSMMESIHKREEDWNFKVEEKVEKIRSQIEKIELEISKFIGRKNGKYYNKIKEQLQSFSNELNNISSNDDNIMEQVKLCNNYIGTCLSFLKEKASDDNNHDDDEDDDFDDIVISNVSDTENSRRIGSDNNLSTQNIKTTYI